MGLIKHLAEFLSLLSMPCRISYLPLLDEILKRASPYNWRLRKSLASQLSSLVLLPPSANVYSTLFPLAMTLLQDPVAEVRIESFSGVAQLLLVLQPGYSPSVNGSADFAPVTEEESETYLSGVARAINSLTHSETYQHRQLWAELALTLLKLLPQPLFERYFLDYIFRLTSDSVLNVRIGIARMLSGWKYTSTVRAPWEDMDCPWRWLLDRSDIKECVQRLSHDDHDVYLAVVNLQPLFPDLEFQSISCRGMKAAPGGAMPVHGGSYHHDHESELGQESDGRLSRASSLSSHDEVDISGQGFPRSHSSTQLANAVTIPNLGTLRVDEVEFDIGTEMEPPEYLEDILDNTPSKPHTTSSEDYDDEEEQRIALRRKTASQASEQTHNGSSPVENQIAASESSGESQIESEEGKSEESEGLSDTSPQESDLSTSSSEATQEQQKIIEGNDEAGVDF
jgi:hypothetical protein